MLLKKMLTDIPRPNRIEFIDISRGIFVTWMITAHALTLSGVPANSPLWYLRPPYWATTCFTMLSGLSIALVVYSPNRDLGTIKKRLFIRATKIGLIAYISNSILRVIKIFLEGSLDLATVVDILTFQYPWSISAILIPVTILLLMAPYLIWISRLVNAMTVLFGATLLALSYSFIVYAAPMAVKKYTLFQILFFDTNPLNFFPIYKYVTLAILCFAIGSLIYNNMLSEELWTIILPSGFLLLTAYNFLPGLKNNLPIAVICTNQFLISIGLSFIINNEPILLYFKKILCLMGRSSLFVFIFHRIILQSLNVFMPAKTSQSLQVFTLFLATTVSFIVLCVLKEEISWIQRPMKKIGF